MRSAAWPYIFIAFIGAILFIPFLGNVHLFDWDEINFAESAREMIETGNYFSVQIDYKPFWEKPPLFIWMQALSMKLFGVNEFAARLPNALIGIVTLVTIFHIGKKLQGSSFGFFWVIAWVGSLLPHFYFKSGIIDPSFNLFIFSGIYFTAKTSFLDNADSTGKKYRFTALAGFFIGLAVLTKGPVGLLLFLITVLVYRLVKRKEWTINLRQAFLFGVVFLIVSFAWYGVYTMVHGLWFVDMFVRYHLDLLSRGVAGHSGPFYYHFIVLLIGCFPASAVMLSSFKGHRDDMPDMAKFRLWMVILFFVVLIIFSIVQTKIVHYSSLTYFPITFLAAYAMDKLRRGEYAWKWYNTLVLLLVGIVFAIALIAAPVAAGNLEMIIPLIKDAFARGNLEADVVWTGGEAVIGIFFMIMLIFSYYLIQRKMPVRGLVTLFISTALVIQLVLIVFVPKIEGYTQRAAIEFYESLQGKDVYVEVLEFKSYAHLFYTRKQPVENRWSRVQEWLLTGDIDKPAYFVVKNIRAEKYRAMPQLKELYSKNGFVFFKRDVE